MSGAPLGGPLLFRWVGAGGDAIPRFVTEGAVVATPGTILAAALVGCRLPPLWLLLAVVR